MPLQDPPNVTSVEVIPTRAEPADTRRIAHIASIDDVALEEVCFLVLIRLVSAPEATSLGLDLYLDDYRIERYWQFPDGIFFKVYNPRFFEKHGGKAIRFRYAGVEYVETGFRLPGPEDQPLTAAAETTPGARLSVRRLPTQATVLRGSP